MPHHAEWTRSTKANNSVLVNGKGQAMRNDKASGKISYFEDKKAYTYLVGDASPAYMGLLRSFKRHILFLRPGVFLMLDQLEAPTAVSFQWMLHAFNKMKVARRKVISQKDGARLSTWFASSQDLVIRQTDKFDIPYNTGIPEEFHKEVENHWHVTVETMEKASRASIATIMSVDTVRDKIDIDLLSSKGWFGARAAGSFGQVEGWIQFEPDSAAPEAYNNLPGADEAIFLAKDTENKMIIY
jgi:hypothetical protein